MAEQGDGALSLPRWFDPVCFGKSFYISERYFTENWNSSAKVFFRTLPTQLREGNLSQIVSPGGTHENSSAFQCRDRCHTPSSPEGTTEIGA